jgi:hypothetical protein
MASSFFNVFDDLMRKYCSRELWMLVFEVFMKSKSWNLSNQLHQFFLFKFRIYVLLKSMKMLRHSSVSFITPILHKLTCTHFTQTIVTSTKFLNSSSSKPLFLLHYNHHSDAFR